jgi:tol-pal system protein YbgF
VLRSRASWCLGLGLLSGCALRGDVRKVDLQVEALRAEVARSDSARRAERDTLARALAALQAALTAQQNNLVQIRGDIRTDLQAVQQQLATLQELTGQSQQRLSELRSRISPPPAQAVPPPADTTGAAPADAGAAPAAAAAPGPDQMYDLTLQQYRRGSFATARTGFREFLRLYSDDDRAPDALYYVGESFAPENSDSAAAVYQDVVKRFPNSPRAASALYKLGLLAEQRNDKAAARTFYARVLAGYPRSDEANLARDKLQTLGH